MRKPDIKLSNALFEIFIDDGAFCGCKSLKTVEIPNGLETIEDYAFAGCKSLEEVTIPEYVEIGYRAFDDTLRKRRTF